MQSLGAASAVYKGQVGSWYHQVLWDPPNNNDGNQLTRTEGTVTMMHTKCRLCLPQRHEYTELMLRNQNEYVHFSKIICRAKLT